MYTIFVSEFEKVQKEEALPFEQASWFVGYSHISIPRSCVESEVKCIFLDKCEREIILSITEGIISNYKINKVCDFSGKHVGWCIVYKKQLNGLKSSTEYLLANSSIVRIESIYKLILSAIHTKIPSFIVLVDS